MTSRRRTAPETVRINPEIARLPADVVFATEELLAIGGTVSLTADGALLVEVPEEHSEDARVIIAELASRRSR